MSQLLASVSTVSAGYHGRAVIHDVSLEVRAGESWVVLGPNGAGKSTVAKAMLGVVPLLRGSVTVCDVSLPAPAAVLAKRVAWVPQNIPESLDFTGLEVALLGRAPHLGAWGLTGGHDVSLARAALAELGVAHLEHRSLREVSGGESRRVFIARAFVQEPQLLILDEPTAFLDVRHQVEALQAVRRRLSATFGALAVLHDVNLAAHFATHVVLMKAGRVVAKGPTREVLTAENVSAVFDITMRLGGETSFSPAWES